MKYKPINDFVHEMLVHEYSFGIKIYRHECFKYCCFPEEKYTILKQNIDKILIQLGYYECVLLMNNYPEILKSENALDFYNYIIIPEDLLLLKLVH